MPQLARAGLNARVLAKMIAAALMNFGDPRCHALRCVGKFHTSGPDAFDKHEPGDAFWKGAGVKHRNGAAHGVADEFKARRAERLDDAIEIEDVVGKMIIPARADPAAVAMAAAVRRNDPERLLGFIL